MPAVFALRRAPRLSCAVLTLMLAGCLSASSAHAAATVAVTISADPAESITAQVGAAGSVTDPQQYLVVKYKPTGGSACGANPDADNGRVVIGATSYLTSGAFAQSANVTFDLAGDYLGCAWVMQYQSSGPNTVVAADAKPFRVRIPHLALTLGVPVAVPSDQMFQATATAQAEAARYLSLYAVPDTGRGCPANASAANATAGERSIVAGQSILGGPTSVTNNVTIGQAQAGAWLLCGYFNRTSASDEPPEASATAAFTVVAPPPPPPACVVPAVVKDEPLAATKGRLAAASCSVGKVRYVASARYARGSVFRVAPVAGTSLANAAPVDLYVSSGAPCIVPAIPKSRTLGSVKRRLAQAGCTVGRVTHRRSRSVRRGRVVALSRPKGKRLAPRTTVAIVVSSGRPR